MYESKRQEQDAVIADLKLARQPHEDLWRDIDDHISPGGLRLTLSDTAKGTRDDAKIINGTADKCFETFQNGMIAYGTNPSEPWVEIGPEDPDLAKYGPVANFCEDVAKDQLAIIEDAGVYEDFKAVFGNGGKFGNGLMWMEERLDGRVIHTQSMAPGQWWIGKDEYGDPNVFYREIRMTVRQAVQKFGGDPRKPDWEKFSTTVKREWDAHRYGTAVDVGHLVMPNDEWDPRHVDAKDKRFKSCYFEIGTQDHRDRSKYLRESGYDLFPALFFPWEILGDDVYGMNSPGMVSLADVKELQHWALKTAETVDKMVNPPLMGSAAMRVKQIGYFPGAFTPLTDQDLQRGGLRPLHEIGAMGKVLEANDRETRIEMRIKDAWHMNAFRFLDAVEDKQRTATEWAYRQQQSMLELVGAMNRINRGILNPFTERLFKYQIDQGRVGGPFGIQIPEELDGQKLKIRYVSRMAQAMRSVNIAGIDRMLETAVLISKENPGVWNTINVYEAMYAKAKAMDVPARVMRSAEEVQEIEAAQAKAQAQQAQAEQIQSMTQSAKNLAQAPTDEKNALTDVVGALSGQAA
jgi:hypothetical protein